MKPVSRHATATLDDLFRDFPSSGFTAIPHDLLDWLAPRLSEAELRVLLYICRRTYGFGKMSDKISLNQFCNGPTSRSGEVLDLGTGLSRQGILNGLAGLEGKGIIRVQAGRGRSQVSQYEIALTDEARERIIRLRLTPREAVNTVDPWRKTSQDPVGSRLRYQRARKGQPRDSKKVNSEPDLSSKKVHGVDLQETEVLQEREGQEKASCAQVNLFFSENTPPSEHSPERGMNEKLAPSPFAGSLDLPANSIALGNSRTPVQKDGRSLRERDARLERTGRKPAPSDPWWVDESWRDNPRVKVFRELYDSVGSASIDSDWIKTAPLLDALTQEEFELACTRVIHEDPAFIKLPNNYIRCRTFERARRRWPSHRSW